MDLSARMRSSEPASVYPVSARERWTIAGIVAAALAVRLAYGPLHHRLAAILVNRYGVTGDVVAAPEIGAFGYSYPGPLLDLNGLVTPLAAGRDIPDLPSSQQPPWLVSYNTFIPAAFWQSSWFLKHYRPVVSIENWETRRLVLFRWYPDPEPGRSSGPVLGDSYELVGRHLSWDDTARGLFLRVELVWSMRAQASLPTTFSVQVLDSADRKLAQQDNEPQTGHLVGQVDGPPASGKLPTSGWWPGEVVVDQRTLPNLTPAGVSHVAVGLYRAPAGPRVARTDAPADSVTLVANDVPACR